MIADLIESDAKLEENEIQKAYNPGIIYCKNYEESDQIAEQLCKAGVESESYHLFKNDSDSILKKWKDGAFPVLVTHEGTFNLGIGRSSLKFVLFLSFPQSLRTFYQVNFTNVQFCNFASPNIFGIFRVNPYKIVYQLHIQNQ